MTTRTATKRTADDQPFDFNLDAVQAEADLTPFRVHWGGRRWEMRHAEELDVWKLAEDADAGDAGTVLTVLRIALGPEQWPDFKKVGMPQYKMKALFDAYKAHCGLGESGASSDS
ncbi:hypothetical protein [Streptomyces youssoufiensis]